MNTKTAPAKKPTRTTHKDTYAAKIETLRRKEIRKFKREATQ